MLKTRKGHVLKVFFVATGMYAWIRQKFDAEIEEHNKHDGD